MRAPQPSNLGLQCPVFLAISCATSQEYRVSDAKEGVEAPNFLVFAQNFFERRPRPGSMTTGPIQGFCLKCKTYGVIKDGKEVEMANGRVRLAGFCSETGCTGKISKIVR